VAEQTRPDVAIEVLTSAPTAGPSFGGVPEVDIAIIGAGLSGSLTAVVLGRAGYRVALIDPYCAYPPEFRVEKIGGDQVELLRRLGLLDCVAAASTTFNQVLNARRGHVIDITNAPHYAIFYQDFVNVVRAQFPNSVKFIARQAIDIKTDKERRQVIFSDHAIIEARLVVLATGMAAPLRHKLGIVRRTVSEKHSISFGFNVALGRGATFNCPALTYYGEQVSDGIDYLSLFPIGNVMRANLFTFRDHRDPWARDLRRQPTKTLIETMPGLRPFLGDFEVLGKVQNWTMDLYVLENYLRDGIVLIGDAFQTSCPAAGTGVSRLLTDVHQLCNVHLPRWFASSGPESGEIAQFYDDPVKRAADGRSIRLAHYRRSLTIDDSLGWKARRGQVFLRRRMLGWVKELRLTRAVFAAAGTSRVPPASRALVRR
jgi:2-polyprenyl-6-methoxyphenol hydroxylase-like FAD-dependent oxidoreductase